jgi:hypothetical protein
MRRYKYEDGYVLCRHEIEGRQVNSRHKLEHEREIFCVIFRSAERREKVLQLMAYDRDTKSTS